MIGLGNSVVKRKLAGASVPAAPINIVQPSLSGSGAVGEAVICNKGTWSGSPTPTYTYDFRLDSVSVQNSSSNSYTPLLADDNKTLTCLVTATNSQGSASEGTSNSIVIGIAPSNTIAPTLSPSGTQSTGTVITVGNGTFSGTAPLTYAYRWKRNGSIILGEIANTYTIVAGDDGTVITAEVKATNAYGESSYIGTSNQVDAVNAIAPVNTASPVVSGTAVVGQTLSSTTGTWTGIPTPTYSYQWYSGATPIGTNSSSYTLVSADAGQNIKCTVTATNTAGSASADSNTLAILETILDVTSNAASAWDINVLLRGAYFGSPLLRVRRSGDNAESDFVAGSDGLLNWISVTAFCIAGGGTQNGFVVTVYDQTGNGRHATQSTPANQVQIVSGGALLTETGTGSGAVARAGFRFDGSNDVLEVASSTATYNFAHNGGNATIVGVHRFGSVSNPDTLYSACGNSANDINNVGFIINYDDRSSLSRNNRIVNGVQRGDVAGAAVANVSSDNAINPNQLNLFIAIIDADNATAANRSSVYVNGGSAIKNNSLTNAPSTSNASFNFQWGAAGNNVGLMVGAACSLIIWNSDQTANLTTIKNNRNGFYKTY